MATPAQVALIPPCDMCDAVDSRYFCTDCQINLCERCKVAHQRGPKTKNDTIIPIGQVHQQTQGKVVPVLCEHHKAKLCELYCYTCEMLICPKCLSNKHKTHSFDNIDVLVDSKTSELNKIETNFKGKLLNYDKVLANEGKEHADYMMHIDNLEVKVKGQTEKIVKLFYKLRDKQLSELLALKKNEERRYRAKCNQYQSRLTEIKKSVETVQKAKVSGNAITMIQVVKESTQSYQSLEDPTASNLPRPKFEHDENPQTPLFLQLQGRLNLPAIKVQKTPGPVDVPKPVIDVNNVKVQLRFEIKGKSGFVQVVLPTKNDMAWIAVTPDKHLSLVDTEGRVVKKSVDFDDEIYDAVSYDRNILVVFAKSHCVMRLSRDGNSVATFSNLFPFYPCGLCVTGKQDVMVILWSSLTISSAIKTKVVRLDRKGQVIQEIQYRNQEPLFTCAVSLTSLPTGDLVVGDMLATGVFKVVCLDKSVNYKYNWNGELGGKKVNKFVPTRMAHDDQKVYITDIDNHCVYVLDRHGKAEQIVLNKLGVTQPGAISFDKSGRVWIGCVGNIYVLQ